MLTFCCIVFYVSGTFLAYVLLDFKINAFENLSFNKKTGFMHTRMGKGHCEMYLLPF